MKLAHLCAALAFAGVALFAPAAAAQHAVDPGVVHTGAVERPADAVELTAPMPALGSEYATPTVQARDGAVEVPWGDWLSEALKALGLAVGAFVLWVLRKLPASIVTALDAMAGMLNQGRADALLAKAVNYGINTTSGAVKGKSMSLKVGNEVLERAFEYAIDKAPMFVRFVLGILNARGMIIARLDLDEDVSLPATRGVADTLAEPPAPAPAPAR